MCSCLRGPAWGLGSWCLALGLLLGVLRPEPACASAPVMVEVPVPQTVFVGDPVTFRVVASGSPPLSFQWFRNGSAIHGATAGILEFITAAADDGAAFTVRVGNPDGAVTSPAAVLTIDFGMPGPTITNRLIEATHLWRYDVRKTDPGSAWTAPDDADLGWSVGGGALYVEDASLPAPKTTALPLTPGNLPTTCYFRTTFTNPITDARTLRLVAHALIDDGAVFHLNGAEAHRLGLPGGPVGYGTFANRSVGNAAWEGPIDLPATNLVAGINVLAIEVHQSAANSSDVVLGFTLDALWQPRLRDTQAPVVAAAIPSPGATVPELTQIDVQFSEGVQGVHATDLLIHGVAATNMAVLAPDQYRFRFPQPPPGPVNVTWAPEHGIRDRSVNSNAFSGAGFAYVLGPVPAGAPLSFLRVSQSSDASPTRDARKAVDNAAATSSLTADLPGSYWMGEFGRPFPVDRIEVVNRPAPDDAEIEGLTLRLFNLDDQVVFEQALVNPRSGGIIPIDLPAGTIGRSLWIGLAGTRANGAGNRRVGLAEVRIFGSPDLPYGPPPPPVPSSGPVKVTNNLASFRPSHMVRLDRSVAPASNANDDNYATETKTTQRTVDGYWEVDLGATHALYGVRVIGASGIGSRLTNATVRLYDGAHESVFARRLAGRPETFDMDLEGPVFARYVRVGLEDKQRTDPSGGIEFFIGFREVEVFGRPTNHIGVTSFSASTNRVKTGEPVTLSWAVDDVRRVEIRPGLGSVGALTAANGVGSVTLTLTNSTEFTLVASNAAGLFARSVAVQVDDTALGPQITEIVADNRYSLKDGEGEAPDWIELRNPGNDPVDLNGWGLSDDPAQPMKWTFPATTLAAHGTLLVFASGRSTPFDAAGHLHASFRLEKNGGTITLTSARGGMPVEQITYPELDTDLAYGRDLEGRLTFLEPTPGALNAAPTYEGWVKPTDWSHRRGFYETGFSLTLTNNSPGATLLYSLDGSIPRLTYTAALGINRTRAVRVQAVRAGYRPARIQTRTFLFLDDVIGSSVMNPTITQNPAYSTRLKPGLLALPSVSICLPGQPEYEEREGSLEILWPTGSDPVQVNCGISRFGNAWTKFEKRSIRMKCRARYGDARLHAPLFEGFERGVAAATSFDELDFRSGSQDMNERGFYMAGRFVEDSMLDMGSLNPHGRYVHVYLNGVYWGQYDCREMLVEPFMADYLGGTKDDYVVVRGNDNVSDDFVIGTPEPPHLEPWERVLAQKNSYAALCPYVDTTHLIDFMLLWNYGNCESEFRACGPIDAGSGFKFWIADADGFLRTSAMGLNRTSRRGPGEIFGSLVGERHPDFRMLLADRIYRHFFNDGALTPAANDARLAARLREVQDSLVAECARWGYRTPANWMSAAASVRSGLFPGRTTQLVGYLRAAGLYPSFDPPRFNQYGGLVTQSFLPELTTSSGTIHYTLDGSDPRLPGGAVSPAARTWAAGAVTITQDLTLTARVRTPNGQWSALAQPRFLLASRRPPTTQELLVTEVHYNPPGSEDFEFIELMNPSTNLLDLSGVSLNTAVRFVFPTGSALDPGGVVIVARNPAAFATRYQSPSSTWHEPDLVVFGPWAGALDNQGETLSLVASNGLELVSVPYQSGGDWPERPDGRGSSLELRALPPTMMSDAAMRAWLANGRNWRASSLYHGSPGRLDSFAKRVRINEVFPNPPTGTDEWIELFNAGDQPADLTGWALTDNLDRPARWIFPDATVLAPGQFMLLSSARLGFAFKARGDQAALLQMRGTNVVRFLDTVDFPAARSEQSFGVFLRSDGEGDFTALRQPTPGAPNALPAVGPVVLSEIQFNPAPGKAAFLELANLTTSAIPLYDPARPTNVWRLTGVGEFAFPTNTLLAPCSTLIVCATNPAAFRSQYSLDTSVPVLGPWPGVLASDGETIRLLEPGSPGTDGTVVDHRIDQVTFGVEAPWPPAAAGASLERLPVQAYGSDPASWRPGSTPGTPGTVPENRAPSLRVEGELAVQAFGSMALTLLVVDPDAPWQPPSFRAIRLPPGAVFDESTGVLNWTPTQEEKPGRYAAEFAATDNASCAPGLASLELTLVVTEPNRHPVWVPQPDVTWPAGVPCEILLSVADPDPDAPALRFDAAGLPPGLRFDATAVRVLGTATSPGDFRVTVTASDGGQPPLTATLQFAIHVTAPFELAARADPDGIRLEFPALPGESYRIEVCDDLSTAQWQSLIEIPSASDGSLRFLVPRAKDQSQRFYRVLWLR